MPKYTLTYFNMKALGEGTRMMLAYGGEEWQETTIRFPEDWAEYKPKTPFGQLPIFEIDDKKYTQSIAIARYLGHKYGLAGNNFEEDLEIDQSIEIFNDLRASAVVPFYEKDEYIRNKKYADWNESKFDFLLEKLHEIVVKNNGHLALGRLTWADFYFAGAYDYVKSIVLRPNVDEKYPAFPALVKKVLDIPKIKAFKRVVYPI